MPATGAFGRHYDTGPTVLRMIIAGVFDRFPGLQLVLGHWGEVVLFADAGGGSALMRQLARHLPGTE